MKKLLLTGIAALFLATGTAHAQTYRGPTTADDPMYKVDQFLLCTLFSVPVAVRTAGQELGLCELRKNFKMIRTALPNFLQTLVIVCLVFTFFMVTIRNAAGIVFVGAQF